MNTSKLDLASIRKLHQAGKLDEAKQAYLILLKINPKNVDVLHALGVLYAQQDNFSDAIHHLQTAIQIQPKNPTLYLHLANIFKVQGLFSQAAQTLQQIIAIEPNYIPAYNNLGSVYYAQENFDEAINFYKKALEKQPEYIDAYYNLGLALGKQNKLQEAIDTYNKILALTPEHFAARFQLACALMLQDKITDAEKQFLIIEEAHPYHYETQSNLATCFLKQGALNEAKKHYLNALALEQHDAQILFNLGVINMQQGHLDSAIQNYQRAVQIQPEYFEAHNNLGVAFLSKPHIEFALHHFKQASRIQPKNEAVRYTIEALSKNQRLLASPPDYITSLFDAYADHYDAHLVKALDYQLPTLLYSAVAEMTRIPHAKWDILDIGCGTGLCGVPFQSAAKSLTGVDLSAKMLAEAAQKNIYTDLQTSELTTFLADKHEQYDLILGGDVFVYIGDLDKIFQLAHQALRKSGLLTFNAEICEDGEFKMNQSGRFAHHKNYLDQLADKYKLNVLLYKTVVTRMQNNEPVYGHLYVLQHLC